MKPQRELTAQEREAGFRDREEIKHDAFSALFNATLFYADDPINGDALVAAAEAATAVLWLDQQHRWTAWCSKTGFVPEYEAVA